MMPLLYQFSFSHFNEKARWALDYKGVPHQRSSVPPGAHIPIMLALTGQTKTPVLRVDQALIIGSAKIIDYLETNHPEPRLYPRARLAPRLLKYRPGLTKRLARRPDASYFTRRSPIPCTSRECFRVRAIWAGVCIWEVTPCWQGSLPCKNKSRQPWHRTPGWWWPKHWILWPRILERRAIWRAMLFRLPTYAPQPCFRWWSCRPNSTFPVESRSPAAFVAWWLIGRTIRVSGGC